VDIREADFLSSIQKILSAWKILVALEEYYAPVINLIAARFESDFIAFHLFIEISSKNL
jgi:hypothetical protein